MDNGIVIKPYSKKNSILIVNRHIGTQLGLDRKKRGYVSFGNQKHYVDIIISQRLQKDEIHLSLNVMKDLKLPDFLAFEVRVRGNEILIGPCIGALVSTKDSGITSERLEHVKLSIRDYSNFHGALIVFSLEGVDEKNRQIKGYCFNPKRNSWDKGIYPYPLSIYRTIGLNETWQNHFLSVIGDNVFNGRYFSKWEMYKWFSTEPEIAPSIPDTKLYESYEDIFNMLQTYGTVYVKPNWGMKGHGVVRVSSRGGKYIFQYRKDKKNNTIIEESWEEAEKSIRMLFKPGDYIVQQSIDLLTYDGGVIDFRVVMQKDQSAKWVCTVIVARIGASESIVSNISSGGRGSGPSELLKKVFSISEHEAAALVERMKGFSMKVCHVLDQFGINCGTLGIDIGVDNRGKIWLIEINHRSPHPAIALIIDDLQSYNTIISNPFLYAKALAGFESMEGDE